MTLNLFDLITRADLNAATADKLVNIRDDDAGLRILNYSDGALYTPGAWDNPAVRQCRGIIVDADWNVIARPWSKFFNHGQAEAGELDMSAPVEVTDKMDGSLGIIHLAADGRQRVASRGSFESDQANHATATLRARYPHLASLDSVTPLVEIVYPDNRIVVDYGDLADLGFGITEVCARLHTSRDALEKWCERHAMSDVYALLLSRETPVVEGQKRWAS